MRLHGAAAKIWLAVNWFLMVLALSALFLVALFAATYQDTPSNKL